MTFEYHRLNRSWPKSAWWKPLITGLIAFVFYAVFTLALAVPVLAAVVFSENPHPAFERLVEEAVIDTSDPLMLAFALVSIALMLPSIILATLIMGPRPLGLLSSVAGHLRWRWMLRLLGPVLAVYLAVFSIGFLLVPLLSGGAAVVPEWGADSLALIVVALLLVPVQATAEEYVFRGYLMQTIGTWLKHPAWAILLPVPLFVVGHIYDVWGLLDVAVFGIFAGWITWRTGGLEAAIVAHVLNNTLLYLLSAVGVVDASTTEGSPVGVAMTVVMVTLFGWWVVALQRRHGIARTREIERDPAPELVDAQP
ncbi:CPBP family intramembrane metalloprotease [Salinibacterium sp. SYSU T00001]|uniref:CPBP family intramembrane glutamic endopeptidase n=1 Tax=Homoserinimonas sedimenticola TaxID=2986805 RepID=UPI0022354722|nr:type II CAAX endopeptidase family protein [Salinibacterium sedimenticola]MCW4385463.1 CPBP family intramembrane metalloprotease [Salinibacterium sedimenticola]